MESKFFTLAVALLILLISEKVLGNLKVSDLISQRIQFIVAVVVVLILAVVLLLPVLP